MDSVFDIYDINQYTQNTLRKQTLKFLTLCDYVAVYPSLTIKYKPAFIH